MDQIIDRLFDIYDFSWITRRSQLKKWLNEAADKSSTRFHDLVFEMTYVVKGGPFAPKPTFDWAKAREHSHNLHVIYRVLNEVSQILTVFGSPHLTWENIVEMENKASLEAVPMPLLWGWRLAGKSIHIVDGVRDIDVAARLPLHIAIPCSSFITFALVQRQNLKLMFDENIVSSRGLNKRLLNSLISENELGKFIDNLINICFDSSTAIERMQIPEALVTPSA